LRDKIVPKNDADASVNQGVAASVEKEKKAMQKKGARTRATYERQGLYLYLLINVIGQKFVNERSFHDC